MAPSGEFPDLPPTRTLYPVFEAGQRRFGRFVLERLIGRGGMGVVWRAHDELLNETVALKFLADPLMHDPRALADLQAETRRARQLSHPNIVRIHEFFADETGAALSMEFVEGCSLATALAERRVLSSAEILGWLPGLCGALDYAHGQPRVVHRDLKPGNLLLPLQGAAKLADFGVSWRMAESATRSTHLLSCGTLAYMGPQQLMGDEPAPADDIYALGALLYESVAGRLPFTGGDISLQIRERTPAPPSRHRPAEAEPLPRVWNDVILACLEKDPRLRPISAVEVADALAHGHFASRGRNRRRHRVVLGVAAALGAVAIASGAVALFRGAAGTARDETPPALVAAARSAGDETTALPPLSAPVLVRGSLAQQLVAHLPFDGDTANWAGDQAQGVRIGTAWTEDRFGWKDFALRIMGRGRVELALGRAFRLGPRYPFTLTAWIKPEQTDGVIMVLQSAGKRGPTVDVILNRGKLDARFENGVRPLTVQCPAPLALGRWTHIAVVYDGTDMQVFIDGEPHGQAAWTQQTAAVDHVSLVVGAADYRQFEEQFFGAIDDVRLHRHALGSDALRSIALEEEPITTAHGPLDAIRSFRHAPGADASRGVVLDESPATGQRTAGAWYPWEGGPVFSLTRGRYGETEDPEAIVRREFGQEAQLADWRELATGWVQWTRLAAELAGWPVRDGVFLARNGARAFRSGRYYYATRLDGTLDQNWLEHAEIGNGTLSLGSWMDEEHRVLARRSAADRYTVETIRSGTGGEAHVSSPWVCDAAGDWHRPLSLAGHSTMFCLRLPIDFGPLGARRHGVELGMRTGAPWVVAIEPMELPGDRRLFIRREKASVTSQSELPVNPTPHEMVVVGRQGHLYAALIDATNAVWRGDVIVDSPEFAVESLNEISASGTTLDASTTDAPAVMQWVVWR